MFGRNAGNVFNRNTGSTNTSGGSFPYNTSSNNSNNNSNSFYDPNPPIGGSYNQSQAQLGTYRINNRTDEPSTQLVNMISNWKQSPPMSYSCREQTLHLSPIELRVEDYYLIRGKNLNTRDQHRAKACFEKKFMNMDQRMVENHKLMKFSEERAIDIDALRNNLRGNSNNSFNSNSGSGTMTGSRNMFTNSSNSTPLGNGSRTPGSNIFGNNSNQQSQQQPSNNIFTGSRTIGNANQTGSNNIFGNSSSMNNSSMNNSSMNNSTMNNSQTSANIFSRNSNNPSSNIFGNASNNNNSQQNNTPSNNIFQSGSNNNNNMNTRSSSNIFNNQPQQQQQQSTNNIFGNANQSRTAGNNIFGNASNGGSTIYNNANNGGGNNIFANNSNNGASNAFGGNNIFSNGVNNSMNNGMNNGMYNGMNNNMYNSMYNNMNNNMNNSMYNPLLNSLPNNSSLTNQQLLSNAVMQQQKILQLMIQNNPKISNSFSEGYLSNHQQQHHNHYQNEKVGLFDVPQEKYDWSIDHIRPRNFNDDTVITIKFEDNQPSIINSGSSRISNGGRGLKESRIIGKGRQGMEGRMTQSKTINNSNIKSNINSPNNLPLSSNKKTTYQSNPHHNIYDPKKCLLKLSLTLQWDYNKSIPQELQLTLNRNNLNINDPEYISSLLKQIRAKYNFIRQDATLEINRVIFEEEKDVNCYAAEGIIEQRLINLDKEYEFGFSRFKDFQVEKLVISNAEGEVKWHKTINLRTLDFRKEEFTIEENSITCNIEQLNFPCTVRFDSLPPLIEKYKDSEEYYQESKAKLKENIAKISNGNCELKRLEVQEGYWMMNISKFF